MRRIIEWLRACKEARRLACRVSEEWCGLFIGRRHCSTHNIVWDDGGRCPRSGQTPGQPFARW